MRFAECGEAEYVAECVVEHTWFVYAFIRLCVDFGEGFKPETLNLKIINDNVRRNLRIRHRVRRNRLRSCRNRIHNLRW